MRKGFTWNIQNPAISSLSSGNGPSMTVRLPADITPAFASSSLYFIIAAISSVLGGNLPECRGRQDWP